jgi:hypothetical protein
MGVKYRVTLTTILILLLVGMFVFVFRNIDKLDIKPVQVTKTIEPTPTQVVPIVFTSEQLAEYTTKTMKNPFVLHVRKVLNGYLSGKNTGMENPELVIESRKFDDRNAGLSAFDKSYYKSKFIIFLIDDVIAGGKDISIIFQDKPDMVFTAWVYKLAGGGYDFRAIRDNPKFNLETMKKIQIEYKTILEDKKYGL